MSEFCMSIYCEPYPLIIVSRPKLWKKGPLTALSYGIWAYRFSREVRLAKVPWASCVARGSRFTKFLQGSRFARGARLIKIPRASRLARGCWFSNISRPCRQSLFWPLASLELLGWPSFLRFLAPVEVVDCPRFLGPVDKVSFALSFRSRWSFYDQFLNDTPPIHTAILHL